MSGCMGVATVIGLTSAVATLPRRRGSRTPMQVRDSRSNPTWVVHRRFTGWIAGTSMRIEKILVEDWRFVPHSYAIVNQWQCLQLLNRNQIKLFMHDLPFAQRRWKPVRGLFDATSETAIAALSELPAGEQPDATFAPSCSGAHAAGSSRSDLRAWDR